MGFGRVDLAGLHIVIERSGDVTERFQDSTLVVLTVLRTTNRREISMNEFTKRGEAFEGKFAHEESLRFKAIARRN